MALSSAIATGITMVVILYVLLTMPQIFDNFLNFQETDDQITDIEAKIDDTNIMMSNLATSNGTSLVSFSITNTGQEKLWKYDKFNVLLTYTAASSVNSESLSYAGTCSGIPSSGNWCINTISNDIIEPEIFNSNEIMNIRASITENIAGGTVIAVFSTNNGVVTSTAVKP